MPATAAVTTKPATKKKPKATALRGHMVRVMTAKERIADIKAFGKELRKDKATALAFLKEVGFIDESGEIAEPYRTR